MEHVGEWLNWVLPRVLDGGDQDEVIEIEQNKVSINKFLPGIFGTYNGLHSASKKKPAAPRVTKTIIDNSPQQKRTAPKKSSKTIGLPFEFKNSTPLTTPSLLKVMVK